MSALNDKIASYSIETGIRFNESYVLPPSQTGTITETNAASWAKVGTRDPVFESTVGPAGGDGSWKFVADSTSACRINNTAGQIISRINDQDFSAGIWFRLNSYENFVGNTAIHVHLPYQTGGYGFYVLILESGGVYTPYIGYGTSGSTIQSTGQAITLGNWYYLAARRADSPSGYQLTYYVNGSAIVTENRANVNGSQIGFGSGSTTIDISMNLSNYYMASSSVITPTAISEIWTAGSTAPATVNYSATPMTASGLFVDPTLKIDDIFSTTPATASALMTDPTIAVTVGDHTEITTSITASAEFLSNFAVYTQSNINITISGTLNASAELINNVIVSSGTNASISAVEFTASAEMLDPFVSRAPMTASALMGNAVPTIQPNYFNLVKQSNPYLYINSGTSIPTNHGFQSGTFTKASDLNTGVDGGFPLNLINNIYSWYGGSTNNEDGYMEFTTSTNAESFSDLVGTGNFAYEVWMKPDSLANTQYTSSPLDIAILYNSNNPVQLILRGARNTAASDNSTGQNIPARLEVKIKNSSTTFVSEYVPQASIPVTANNWNHFVVNVYQSGINANQRLVQVWINGQIIINQNIAFTAWDSSIATDTILGGNGIGTSLLPWGYYDEVAIYNNPLTNSEIISHYNFISTYDPNINFVAPPVTADAESGNHQYAVTSNLIAVATPITGSADFVMPSILATKTINYSAPTLTASALNTDVIVYWGWTIYATPAIASAEQKEGFALNTTYYDYVQTNIAPYRYVTFDTATPYADFGTDNDYSVAATVVGGTIVNPDLGINGKSAKTAGTSYITDGIILKESEHDDNWGTGNNSWHSSFWMERAIDDNSTTGLRVLWNLNGAYDDQNIILYHYQNKLHLQINNQVGAPITITSANNINVFDYTRHNIVINSHHNNNNNVLYVYVDATLVLTQNIGSYAVTTINNPIHVGANDEANNFPRLGVGCLITPFADTALPVVPTNTKLILDEIYWDKNQILQTAITDIFNIMPDKVNANTVATALTASAEMSMPTIITNAILSAAPATASGQFVHPSLYLVRLVNVTANVMEASALMAEAIGFVQVDITADVMIASGIFNNAGVIITIPAQAMIATAYLAKNMLFNSLPFTELTSYMRYLRAINQIISQFPMKEVV